MASRFALTSLLAFVWAVTCVCLGCQASSLPPNAEVLVEVDTDAPVPLTVSRLRIDVFDAQGTWFDTRDVALETTPDWPASFSLYSSSDQNRAATVRLRAYAEGFVRDYCAGCIHAPPEDVPFDPSPVPSSISALCALAPKLAWGASITQRRGAYPVLTGSSRPAVSGSVAAQVTVLAAGPHHFDVSALPFNTGSSPPDPPTVNLIVRRKCEDPTSEVDTGTDLSTSSVDLDLVPGNYVLLTGGTASFQPADITLSASSQVESVALDPPSGPDSGTPGQTDLDLVLTNADQTPTTEPLESACIDRLVQLTTAADAKRTAHVNLASACFGTSAKVAVQGGLLQADGSETCIGTPHQLEPLRAETTTAGATPSQNASVGIWGVPVGCSKPAPAGAICIGGGAFVLGGPDYAGFGVSSSVPEIVLRLSPFFLDRTEVTVARYRAAVASGFISPDPSSPKLYSSDSASCTYSETPADRELMAISCLNWYTARAFCQFVAGDLPTEAQWEFAASLAGRTRKTLFPWGNDRPTCDQAVFGRSPNPFAGSTECCPDSGPDCLGPLPVDAADHQNGDLTIQNVLGLGGGVQEWVMDAAHSFGGPCWVGASLVDPLCWEEEATLRSQRGQSWFGEADSLRATTRFRRPPNESSVSSVGFRCAYADRVP